MGQFFGQIQGLKCKLMIWSFNHSGANPDAEEFPADSGSSDFTNPRQQHPLKPRSSYCCCNPQDCPFHGELRFGFALPGLCCTSGHSRLVPKKWLLLLQPSCLSLVFALYIWVDARFAPKSGSDHLPLETHIIQHLFSVIMSRNPSIHA